MKKKRYKKPQLNKQIRLKRMDQPSILKLTKHKTHTHNHSNADTLIQCED